MSYVKTLIHKTQCCVGKGAEIGEEYEGPLGFGGKWGFMSDGAVAEAGALESVHLCGLEMCPRNELGRSWPRFGRCYNGGDAEDPEVGRQPLDHFICLAHLVDDKAPSLERGSSWPGSCSCSPTAHAAGLLS